MNPFAPDDERLPLVPPTGMRDFVFPEAAERSALGATLVEAFARSGYELAITPPFEYAEVLERGLDAAGRKELLRFVDAQSGEVVALRADLTPQIARLVAANYTSRPAPWRMAYRGTVIRRRRGRARKHRQIVQAGVECIGDASLAADVEVIRLAAAALEAAGLRDFRVELNHVRIGSALLAALAPDAAAAAGDALAARDVARLEDVLSKTGAPAQVVTALRALPTWIGGAEVLAHAEPVLQGTRAEAPLGELRALTEALTGAGLGARLLIDLGETRGMSYYTGASFSLLAEGPGEPVASGGRYDALLARFGVDAPSTGFAIDLTNLAWALTAAGAKAPGATRVRLAVPRHLEALAADLRSDGVAVAAVDERFIDAYVSAWQYDGAVTDADATHITLRAADGRTQGFPRTTPSLPTAVVRWLRGAP